MRYEYDENEVFTVEEEIQNIVDEFKKRLIEQEKVVKHINENIKIIEGFYDYNLYLNEIKGLEQLGERSKRCYKCYKFRMEKAALYAKNHNYIGAFYYKDANIG